MTKKRFLNLLLGLLFCFLLAGCAQPKEEKLADGTYKAYFKTDSSMFHVNDALNDLGTLTVKDGEMTLHVSLTSKNILNLYPGLKEDAQKEGATLLEPAIDEVTYPDGMVEKVHGFDIPVPVLDEEFDLALIGKKGKWYDHKVSVSLADNETDILESESLQSETFASEREDGIYTIELAFEGGSGKAYIYSPATVTIKDGISVVTLEWSSKNYDYMIVADEKYMPVSTIDHSIFEIPMTISSEPVTVIGDTIAMSTPHEIEYTITFKPETLSLKE